MLFLICSTFDLSAAKLFRRLPLLKVAVYIISTLCIVRGLLTVPAQINHPELMTTFGLIAGALWVISGVLFLLGYRIMSPMQADFGNPKFKRGNY